MPAIKITLHLRSGAFSCKTKKYTHNEEKLICEFFSATRYGNGVWGCDICGCSIMLDLKNRIATVKISSLDVSFCDINSCLNDLITIAKQPAQDQAPNIVITYTALYAPELILTGTVQCLL